MRILIVLAVLLIPELARSAGEGSLYRGKYSAAKLAEKTTWDSVYTNAQATRGDSIYKATCAKCHGATLAGNNDDGGPLTGAQFLGSWNGQTLDQLFDKIRTTMPSDNPNTLAKPDIAAIVAYLLAQNKFPAGSAPLAEDVEQLKAIKLTTNKP